MQRLPNSLAHIAQLLLPGCTRAGPAQSALHHTRGFALHRLDVLRDSPRPPTPPAPAAAAAARPPEPAWARPPRIRALLVDAAGTLLSPSEPVAAVYARYTARHGLGALDEREVLARFRAAYALPWGGSASRYVGDGRPFWRRVVALSIGSDSQPAFEDIYSYYARGEAWAPAPGAADALARIRRLGVRLAVVSNFDTRLRGILADTGLAALFDEIVVSAEEGVEKPNPALFAAACARLGVPPSEALHVGDDRRNDVFGARDAGAYAWLWGQDVRDFGEVERRLASGNLFSDSLADA